MTKNLAIGDPAPDFELPTDQGQVSLAGLKGQVAIVYFYPKDDTGGCTNQAKAFTAALPDLEALGAIVIGVSKDSLASHAKFRAKHELGVVLASDKDSDVIERFGAWVEKSMYGRTYMGIDRSTWLIDREGVLRAIWRKVKVPGHVEAVLSAVKSLGV
ncbi:MAG: peroxiredoxin [Caulobacter sp.]|nr:peroxiredoxin [Caulobacter sp.]